MVMARMRKERKFSGRESNKNVFLFLSFVFVLSLQQECENDENKQSTIGVELNNGGEKK